MSVSLKTMKILVLGFACVAFASYVQADAVVLPHTFANGTTADADEVNANFDAVKAAVDDNDARVADVQGQVIALDTDLVELDADVITGVLTGLGLTGGASSGDVSLGLEPAVVQFRVLEICPPGQSIRIIYMDGSVECQVDTNSGGDITGIVTGQGLFGGSNVGSPVIALDTAFTDNRYVNRSGDTITGNLGIGTSPSAGLDVLGLKLRARFRVFDFSPGGSEQLVGEWRGSNAYPQVRFASDLNGTFIDIGRAENGDFVVESTSGVERFRIGESTGTVSAPGSLTAQGAVRFGPCCGTADTMLSLNAQPSDSRFLMFKKEGLAKFVVDTDGSLSLTSSILMGGITRISLDNAGKLSFLSASGATRRNLLAGNGDFGAITVSSCSGCSTIAEMMPIEGPISEGEAVCMDPALGQLSQCESDSSLTAFGVATNHAEQVLRMGCATSSEGANSIQIGGERDHWQPGPECAGWYPVAVVGVHEFVKVECLRADGTTMMFGDRLVTSGRQPGRLRPLGPNEQGGDAVLGKAMTLCQPAQDLDQVHMLVR